MGFFSKKPSVSESNPASAYVAPTISSPATASPRRKDIESPLAVDESAEKKNDTSPPLIEPISQSRNQSLGEEEKTIQTNDDNDTLTYDTRTLKTEFTGVGPNTIGTVASMDSEADSAFTITKNGQYLTMNGFANGHLMRWKFAAEEGPALIRFPALLLALAVITTTLFPIVVNEFLWSVSGIICASHTVVSASLIIILEGRVLHGSRAPTGRRARLRAVVTKYFNILRLLWGRGLLYIYVGTMSMTIDHPYALITGCTLITFGLVALAFGAHAAYNLDKMKTSLTDEAYLWTRFDSQDQDHDNYIGVDEFSELLYGLGMEFDDAYTYKAFSQINPNVSGKITFEDFRDWWIVVQNKGKMLRNSSRP